MENKLTKLIDGMRDPKVQAQVEFAGAVWRGNPKAVRLQGEIIDDRVAGVGKFIRRFLPKKKP